MKRLSLLLVMLVFGTASVTLRAADKAPTMSIDAALKIAQNYLQGAAPGGRYISALSLENPTVVGTSYWYARWSTPITNEGKAEVGLHIDMDGSLTKVVSEGGRGSGSTKWGADGPSVPIPGVGSQKFGVRNMH